MAVSFGAVALDEGCGAEVLQTGSRTRQGLTATLGTCAGVLKRSRGDLVNKEYHLQLWSDSSALKARQERSPTFPFCLIKWQELATARIAPMSYWLADCRR